MWQTFRLKLTENNFLLWETQVVLLIESPDLLGFLTGDTEAPQQFLNQEGGNEAVNPDYIPWIIKTWIIGTLSEEVLWHAVGLSTALQVWKAPVHHFKQSLVAREFDLLAQLQHIEKGTNSLSVYLRDFKSICDQLGAIGKPVSDTNKVFRLFGKPG